MILTLGLVFEFDTVWRIVRLVFIHSVAFSLDASMVFFFTYARQYKRRPRFICTLTSSNLLFKLNMAPIGSVTISISLSKTTFKKLELIISEGCVIFLKSLIGATIQDGGKRERRNVLKFLSFAISNFSCYFTFAFILLSSSATTSFAFSRSFSLFQLIMLHYKPFPLYQILYDLSYFYFI